jgi:hypothetical protein
MLFSPDHKKREKERDTNTWAVLTKKDQLLPDISSEEGKIN